MHATTVYVPTGVAQGCGHDNLAGDSNRSKSALGWESTEGGRMGTLHYGDNLTILREHIVEESVDLVYLDPPFNSNANYNVLFRAPDGHQSHAQMEASRTPGTGTRPPRCCMPCLKSCERRI